VNLNSLRNRHQENRRYWRSASLILVVFTLILAGCAPAATPVPPSATPVPAQPTAVPPTAVPTAMPTSVPPTAMPPTAVPQAPQPTANPNVPVAVLPTPGAGAPSVTANYNTYILGGPGNNYPVYGAFLGGKTATAVGKSQDGQWWVVSVPPAPGGQGWVIAPMVTATGADNLPVVPAPPVPPTVQFTPPGPSDPQVVALANVNVRSGPGETYPVYGIGLQGQTALVIGKSQDGQWWTIRLNPANVGVGFGWVSVTYTQASNVDNVPVIQAPPPPTPQPLPPPATSAPTATALEYVNVRTGPGTNYPVLGVAAPGTTGEVTGKSQDGAWWQVKVPTKYISTGLGWVSAGYVTTQNTANVPVVSAPPAPPAPTPQSPSSNAACQIVSQSPADNSVLQPNTSYTFTWTIKNTGSTKWDQNEYDVIFVSATNGESVHQGSDVYDLPSTVQPGQTITISGTGITPASSGAYTEEWAIAQGSQIVCPFWVSYKVQ
jgi:uncharacterized protein YraI